MFEAVCLFLEFDLNPFIYSQTKFMTVMFF